ncbi:hypothetical protein [Alienimonas californiensis]|uniref:Uncharacterized protein n=1 Tax=Alienimonas californiensis TaxID=2527989 RepID=A0A517PCC3_9PLAN|nr:hypothetical protein [Alienimonas californiensis]QDT17019.1 hypothetical protein CA12_31300 [Alienimonas californiensis]
MAKVCAATGEPFPPGARVRSALVDRDGGHVRLDFLQAVWDGPPPGTIGHWAVRAPDAVETPDAAPLDAEELLALLDSLGDAADANNDRQARVRYTLALLLLSEGRVELTEARDTPDGRLLILTGSGGEGPFEVPDLALPEEEIGGLEAGLPALLKERAD